MDVVDINDIAAESEKQAKFMPVVANFDMEPKHYRAFYLFLHDRENQQIAHVVGEDAGTISEWKKSEWWQELLRQQISVHQSWFETELYKKDTKLLAAYDSILEGKEKFSKTANAIATLFKHRSDVGSDPLVKKPGLTINNNTQINQVNITSEDIKTLTQSEMLEFKKTGKVPKKIKKVN